MSWKKLSSEVLVRIIAVIIIDTVVLAANLQFFSGCFLLGKIMLLIWTYILTKGPWHVLFLFAFMWANRTSPSRCHINHHIEESCSDVLVHATLKKQVLILFSCYFSIYLQMSMVHIIVTSKNSFCFSILTVRMKIKIFWVSLQSF